jgi:uncharacterized protein YndB with AHSA1/START domain
MSTINHTGARAVANVPAGQLSASVEIPATPEQVFRSLASNEITKWWVRPGVFDTREWSGDVRAGGKWRAAGMSRGQPYVQAGEFIEIDSPRRLVHTWEGAGKPEAPSTVTYNLERIEGGTRLTLRQGGFVSPEVCNAFAIGWETSFERLAEILSPEVSRA